MSLVDAHKFGMSLSDGEMYGVSEPERRPIVQDRTLIRGNRTKTNERYRVRISQSLAEQLEALGSPAFPDTYVKWREDVNKVIRQSGVKMTPHGFRTIGLLNGWRRVSVSRTWLTWWAHLPRRFARPIAIGSRKPKTGLTRFNVRHGLPKAWTRTGIRKQIRFSQTRMAIASRIAFSDTYSQHCAITCSLLG